MKCKQCGTKIPVGSVYCEKCGREVQIVPDFSVLDDEIESAVSIEEVINTDNDNIHPSLFPRNPRQNLKLILIAVFCIILVITVFIAGSITNKHKNSYDYQIERAEEALENEEYNVALEYFFKALELDEKRNGALEARIAEVYDKLGNSDSAVEYYMTSIGINPSNPEAFTYLINYYLEKEDYVSITGLKKYADSKDILELFSIIIVPSPYFSLEEGTYNGIKLLELKEEGDYPIYYTLDGSEPTVATGYLYNGPIELSIGTTVVTAVAYDEKRGDYSQEIQGTYTITVKAPEPAFATPEGGIFTEPQYISITTDSEDGNIYYTLDGKAPTEKSELYTEPFLLPLGESHLAVAVINEFGIRSEINYYDYFYGAL